MSTSLIIFITVPCSGGISYTARMAKEAFAPPWETGEVIRNPKGPSQASKSHQQKLAERTEDGITPTMKARRDAFVLEYLVDFKQTAAAIRMGTPAGSAPQRASEYMHEPYVLQQIQLKLEEMEEAHIVTRNRILAGLLREAGFEAPGASHAARVNAWGKLAGILGMEVKKLELSTPEAVELHVTIGSDEAKPSAT